MDEDRPDPIEKRLAGVRDADIAADVIKKVLHTFAGGVVLRGVVSLFWNEEGRFHQSAFIQYGTHFLQGS